MSFTVVSIYVTTYSHRNACEIVNATSLTTFCRELKIVLFRTSINNDYAIVIVLHTITVV